MTIVISKRSINTNASFKKVKSKPISTVRFNLDFSKSFNSQSFNDNKLILDQLKKLKVKKIVFHSECKSIKKIISYAQSELKFKTAVSIKVEMIEQFKDTLTFIDEIELSQDDPKNACEMDGNINLIKYLQKNYPHIAITVKTIVSSHNKDLLAYIIKPLEPLSFYDPKFKWKVYQIKEKDTLSRIELISKEQFKESFSKMYLETLWADYPFLEKYEGEKNDDQSPMLQIFSNGQVYSNKSNMFLGDILNHPRAFFDNLKRIKSSL